MSELSLSAFQSPAKNSAASAKAAPEFLAAPPSGFARLRSWPARSVSFLIWIYQQAVSPTLAALNPTCGCRFAPTCSHYAREALHAHGLVHGLFLTVRRLVKCGPWHPGGEDPVPPRRHPVCTRISVS